jgi:TATA-box binding protein (TBP) (component of TFIID and TFIIIB)
MLNEKEAKEMAKYIVLGVRHFDDIHDQISVTMDILEKYNVIEKEKSMFKVPSRVMGVKNGMELEEALEVDEDVYEYEEA